MEFTPGFRFYPTEEELVSFYLHNKLEGKRPEIQRVIPDLGIYDIEPWHLPSTILFEIVFTSYSVLIDCFKISNFKFDCVLQSFQESGVKRTLSNGFSLRQDKKEKLGEEDPAELQFLGTGRQQALLATCIHRITG
jgi:hypothetical protein